MRTGCSGEHLDSERSKKQEAEELGNEASTVPGSFYCSGINIDMYNFTIALLWSLVQHFVTTFKYIKPNFHPLSLLFLNFRSVNYVSIQFLQISIMYCCLNALKDYTQRIKAVSASDFLLLQQNVMLIYIGSSTVINPELLRSCILEFLS